MYASATGRAVKAACSASCSSVAFWFFNSLAVSSVTADSAVGVGTVESQDREEVL